MREHEPPIESNVSGEELERVIDNVRTQTLELMVGQFNRLVYLASLRDYNTARYHHYGLESRYGSEAVDEGLRRCHIKIFEELMALPLQDQTRDLIQFFESLQEDRPRMIEVWGRLRSYQVLPPENCHPLARQLFDQNIEVMLRVLRETDLWPLLHEPHSNADHLA
jgi:hypothetical protein